MDNFSIENAIILANASRWPILIDPQNQANKWIRLMEKSNQLKVIKQTDKDILRVLENCLQFGLSLLIENIKEDLNPILDPVLLKIVSKQNNIDYIKISDGTVEYSKNFRLFMTTRLKNPNYLPEISVKVKLINFVITPQGLQDQLLSIVTRKEKPELEAFRDQLIIQSAQNKKQLKEIEDKILEVLAASKGDILEDETAVEVLSASKLLTYEIINKQHIAKQTESEIDSVRNQYARVALYSSQLFFIISDLELIHSFYQFSLDWFLNLYELVSGF